MKVFLDSNVIFSICWSGIASSRSGLLFELQNQGHIQLFISRLVHDETLFNLQTKRQDAIPVFRQLTRQLVILADSYALTAQPDIMKLPLNDRVILMTAMSSGMEFFITGNSRDFSDIYGNKLGGMLTLQPADFLNKIFEG